KGGSSTSRGGRSGGSRASSSSALSRSRGGSSGGRGGQGGRGGGRAGGGARSSAGLANRAGDAAVAQSGGMTGQQCGVSGVYRCVTHPENTIPLSEGETFPPCSVGGGHSADWALVRSA